jgi:hypothetical protein
LALSARPVEVLRKKSQGLATSPKIRWQILTVFSRFRLDYSAQKLYDIGTVNDANWFPSNLVC